MDATKLLESQVPEIIIMALLAAYPEKETEVVLRYIVRKLKIVCESEKDLDRYLTQLLFFSRLRNLEDETTKIVQNMPIRYDISKDALYLQGIEKGIEKGKKQLYIKLLDILSVSDLGNILVMKLLLISEWTLR